MTTCFKAEKFNIQNSNEEKLRRVIPKYAQTPLNDVQLSQSLLQGSTSIFD